MIRIHGLNQYYGEGHVLRNVDLHIPAGSCTCLMGRNGVGKTTLLKTIMGILSIASGSLRFEDTELTRRPAALRARLGIGYVPQGREIFPQLTVEENLRVGLPTRRDALGVVPESVFHYFPVLKEMLGRRGGDLSGGQQQQLAIGRALALNPKLLMLDEPTEGIQPNIVEEIGDILLRLNQEENLTIFLVEQKLPFARRVANAFAVMEKGSVVADGPITALTDDIVQRHLSV